MRKPFWIILMVESKVELDMSYFFKGKHFVIKLLYIDHNNRSKTENLYKFKEINFKNRSWHACHYNAPQHDLTKNKSKWHNDDFWKCLSFAGDRVIIYMPLIPEAVMAMLATVRIGAIHSVVFGGKSSFHFDWTFRKSHANDERNGLAYSYTVRDK